MKQFIECPECGAVELAEIATTTIPFNTYIHRCSQCNHVTMESEWNPVPALSIKQPWAWLIVSGNKDIENRNNIKNFRGKFLIHASKQFADLWFGIGAPVQNELAYEKCHGRFYDFADGEDFDKGGIIGYATITGCVEESDSPWFVGKYGLIIEDPHGLPFTPCKGKLSFFKPEIE